MVFAGSTRLRSLWTPERISTALWLDAADSSTVTITSGAVSQWNDKSGNSRNVSQSTSTRRPTYSNNGIVFDGLDDYMESGANYTATSGSVFLVASAVAGSLNSTGRVWLSINPTALTTITTWNGYIHLLYRNNITSYVRFLQSSNAESANLNFQYLLSNYTFPEKSLFGLEFGSTQNFYHQGTLQETDTGLVAPNISNGVICLNHYYNLSSNYNYTSNGTINEIVICDVLNETDRQKMEGYLAHKWGLTSNLPSDHPYKQYSPKGA